MLWGTSEEQLNQIGTSSHNHQRLDNHWGNQKVIKGAVKTLDQKIIRWGFDLLQHHQTVIKV